VRVVALATALHLPVLPRAHQGQIWASPSDAILPARPGQSGRIAHACSLIIPSAADHPPGSGSRRYCPPIIPGAGDPAAGVLLWIEHRSSDPQIGAGCSASRPESACAGQGQLNVEIVCSRTVGISTVRHTTLRRRKPGSLDKSSE
jgi:hypothetical protein